MSKLSAVLSTRVGRHRKFGEVSWTKCTGHGNDFEFILTMDREIIHPVEGYFVSEFPAICNHCGVMASEVARRIFEKFLFFFGKTNPYGKIFKTLFRKFSSRHRSTCNVQISWSLADGKSVKSCVA